MFDVMTMLSDTALTEQLLSCQKSKIEFSKYFGRRKAAVVLRKATEGLRFACGQFLHGLHSFLTFHSFSQDSCGKIKHV